jgi:HEAT repeat protein
VTSQGSPGTRFQRSVQTRNVFLAETAAFELGTLSLENALQLVVLYAEAEDDKFDKAAVRWLGRLLLERPMPLAVVAHSVELVSQLRGPGAGWSARALETLARP